MLSVREARSCRSMGKSVLLLSSCSLFNFILRNCYNYFCFKTFNERDSAHSGLDKFKLRLLLSYLQVMPCYNKHVYPSTHKGNFLHTSNFLCLLPNGNCTLNIRHQSYCIYYISFSHQFFQPENFLAQLSYFYLPTNLEFPIRKFDHSFLFQEIQCTT